MTKKYVNKFHKLKFETNSKKDLETNAPTLNKDLFTQIIGDNSSNEIQLEYEYAAKAQENDFKQ